MILKQRWVRWRRESIVRSMSPLLFPNVAFHYRYLVRLSRRAGRLVGMKLLEISVIHTCEKYKNISVWENLRKWEISAWKSGAIILRNVTAFFARIKISCFIRKTIAISCQKNASTPSRYKSEAKTEAKFRRTMPKSCLFGHINEFLFFFQFLHIWVVCTFLWEYKSH
mgnify:CR=1 FL=1